jgi:hypothetical protein
MMPGDPLLMTLEGASPDRPVKAEEIERMRAIFGLNDPWYVAYWHWLTKLLQGDMGDSLSRPRKAVMLGAVDVRKARSCSAGAGRHFMPHAEQRTARGDAPITASSTS